MISPGPSDFDLDLDAEKAGISLLYPEQSEKSQIRNMEWY
jgi:hypothetical protein